MAKKILNKTTPSAHRPDDVNENTESDAEHSEVDAGGTQPTARVYKGTQVVDHDLFKLLPALMKKDVSFNPEKPIYEYFEHAHIFHTVDSNGKALDKCNDVGGHFHTVEVVNGKNGVPTLKVSVAMKVVRLKKGGPRVAVEVRDDNHTHAVKYLGSEKIELRKTNVDAAQYMSEIRSRVEPKPVPGVSSL
jgi:uncharacterized protein YodC (DUF2158 family)